MYPILRAQLQSDWSYPKPHVVSGAILNGMVLETKHWEFFNWTGKLGINCHPLKFLLARLALG